MSSREYLDDPTIPDKAELLRRIPSHHFYFDENLGQVRPSSAAFDDPDGSPMSVILAEVLSQSGRALETTLAGHEGFALASITAGLARECGQGIAREPLPDEPAHAVVFGKKTKGVRKRLARAALWVVSPQGLPSPYKLFLLHRTQV